MRRKITIKLIRSEVEKENYDLITDVYINSRQKLKCICPNGHIWWMTWHSWNSGHRCLTCSGKKKLTIEFISYKMAKEGCTLLSTNYINAMTKLDYVCKNGHIGSIKWNDWQQGKRCIMCYTNSLKPATRKRRQDSNGNVELTIEYVRSNFEKYGFTLLSKVYINSRTKLKYRCPNGYEHQITWGHWNTSKARCPCKKCNPTGYNFKYTLEQTVQEYKKIGYTLLSTKYIDCKTKMKCICDKGHTIYMSLYAVMHKHKCKICVTEDQTGSGNPNWKGGVSYEPYCPIWKDKEFKELIKQRDSYKCMNPCCTSKDPNDLTGHHIEYNKKLCGLKDIITVCRSCNNTANGNREFHEAWYKAIMYRRYGYVYE